MVERVMLKNVVKLKLLASIHPVVNVSEIVRYKELVEEQGIKELEVNKVEKQKVKKILNKRKI